MINELNILKEIPIPMGINTIKVNCEFLPQLADKIKNIKNFTKNAHANENISNEKFAELMDSDEVYRYIFEFSDDWEREWSQLTNGGKKYIAKILAPYVQGTIIQEQVWLHSEGPKHQEWIVSVGCATEEELYYEFNISFYNQFQLDNESIFFDIEAIPSEFIKFGTRFVPKELSDDPYENFFRSLNRGNTIAQGEDWVLEYNDQGVISTSSEELKKILIQHSKVVPEILKSLSTFLGRNIEQEHQENWNKLVSEQEEER